MVRNRVEGSEVGRKVHQLVIIVEVPGFASSGQYEEITGIFILCGAGLVCSGYQENENGLERM